MGGWVGEINNIDHLSPVETEIRTELGKNCEKYRGHQPELTISLGMVRLQKWLANQCNYAGPKNQNGYPIQLLSK